MKKDKKSLLLSDLSEDLICCLKECNAVIAGGAITSVFKGVDINDYDVYFKTDGDMYRFLMSWWCEKHYRTSSHKALNFVDWEGENSLIQVITLKSYPTIEDIWNDFDFTVCMGAFDFSDEKFHLHKDFIYDNISNTLNFNKNTAFPIVSLKRVDKYKNKGYSINLYNMYQIAFAIKNLEINNYQELCNHLGGMYGEEIDDLFDEIKDEPFDIDKALKCIDEKSDRTHTDLKSKYDIRYPILVDLRMGIPVYYDCIRPPVLFDKNGNISPLSSKDVGDFYAKSLGIESKELEETLEFPMKFVKYVKKKEDGRYVSFYDGNFEYKEGECYDDVYGSHVHHIGSSTYSNAQDRAFAYCHINCIEDLYDYKTLGSSIYFKKLYVDKIVPIKDGELYPEGFKFDISISGSWEFEDDKSNTSSGILIDDDDNTDYDWELSL